jgi:hypothetical protein
MNDKEQSHQMRWPIYQRLPISPDLDPLCRVFAGHGPWTGSIISFLLSSQGKDYAIWLCSLSPVKSLVFLEVP